MTNLDDDIVIEFIKKGKDPITDEYKNQVIKDLNINFISLLEDFRDAPNITQKYIEDLITQKRILRNYELDLDTVRGELFVFGDEY